MSFTYAGTSTDTLAGVTATLKSWPSLGGLSVETVDVPGQDGLFYASHQSAQTEWVFDVIVQGTTPAQVAARRDAFVGLLDPSRGPRPLIVETDTAWQYTGVMVTGPITWDRMAWARDTGFALRADVTLATVDGDPSATEVTPTALAVAGATSVTLTAGNTATYPRMEFPSGGDITVQLGTYTLHLTGTPTGGTAVLDWAAMDFYVRNASGARTRSLVPFMDTYDRPMLHLGQTVTARVTRAGSTLAATLYPNPRRI